MEIIDIIIAVLLVIGLIAGLKDGFVKQVAGLVGFVAGLLVGKALYLSVAAELTPLLGTSEKTTQIIAFVLIMVLVPLIFSVIAWLISKLLKSVGLGWLNRLGGGIVGMIEYALIAGLIIVGIESFDTHNVIVSKETKENSVFYYALGNTTGLLIKDVKEQIADWKERHGEAATDDADGCKEAKPDLQSFEEVI